MSVTTPQCWINNEKQSQVRKVRVRLCYSRWLLFIIDLAHLG